MGSRGVLYHFAPVRLGPCSTVEPGNWGRILKRFNLANPSFGNAWVLARELVFEQLRPSVKPSRMSSCFVLQNQQDAELYSNVNDRNYLQVLHEVEYVDLAAPSHVGDLSFLDFSEGSPFLDSTRSAAQSYWAGVTGAANRGTEIVAASALRVVRSLE